MLEKIRNCANSIVFKVLLGILLFSFVLSGVTAGFMEGFSNDDYVAKIGNEKIYSSQIKKLMEDKMKLLKSSGLELKPELLQSLGFSEKQILEDLVQRSLISQEISSLKLTVDDAAVAKYIKQMPELKHNGEFNPEKLKLLLYQNGLNEKQFEENIRTQLSTELLIKIITTQLPVTNFFEENSLKNYAQTRNISYIYLPAGYDKLEKVPTEEDLKKFYEEFSVLFEIPESRKVEYIVLENQPNKAELIEKINNLEDEMASGSSLSEAAKKFALKYKIIDNLTKETEELSDKFIEFAFVANENESTKLFEDEAGNNYILNVLSISDSRIPAFTEVQTKIAAEWYKEEQKQRDIVVANEIYNKAKDMESLSKAADEYGLPIEYIKDLKRDSTSEHDYEFLNAAFNANKSQVFGVFEDEKGGFKIAAVAEISQFEPSPTMRKEFKSMYTKAVENDILEQYLDYLRTKYPVVRKDAKQENNLLEKFL